MENLLWKRMNLLLLTGLLVCFFVSSLEANLYPEQGIFKARLSAKAPIMYGRKTLYHGSSVSLNVGTFSEVDCVSDHPVDVRFVVIGTHCKGKFSSAATTDFVLQTCFRKPEICSENGSNQYVTYVLSVECGKVSNWRLLDNWLPQFTQETSKNINGSSNASYPNHRKHRGVDFDFSSKHLDHFNSQLDVEGSSTASDKQMELNPKQKTVFSSPKAQLITTPFMGEYFFMVGFEKTNFISDVDFTVIIKMHGSHGYLSPHEYPLLIFYEIMCVVYSFYIVAWIVISMCNYRHLLHVHIWIGVVILLNFMENALRYSEYLTVNMTGVYETGMQKFAAVISCFKSDVARILLLILSWGYGIVNPKISPILCRIVGFGIVYFIPAVVLRMSLIKVDSMQEKLWIVVYILSAVIDSIFCAWLFRYLHKTMKDLRIQGNFKQLSLFRYFLCGIIFCVLASIVTMIWSIHHSEQACIADFSNMWFETAFWPILFSFLLLVIMILWIPSVNYDYHITALSEKPLINNEEDFTQDVSDENDFVVGDQPEHYFDENGAE